MSYRIILEDGSELLNTQDGQTAFGWVNHVLDMHGHFTQTYKIIPWRRVKEILHEKDPE